MASVTDEALGHASSVLSSNVIRWVMSNLCLSSLLQLLWLIKGKMFKKPEKMLIHAMELWKAWLRMKRLISNINKVSFFIGWNYFFRYCYKSFGSKTCQICLVYGIRIGDSITLNVLFPNGHNSIPYVKMKHVLELRWVKVKWYHDYVN